jgi:DNA modification methylase
LINYAHEFILEFEKPAPKGYKKYAHVTKEQKENSKLDKEFWISIKKSDVWLMKPEKSGNNRNHPAPFPYELPYRLIKAYSYEGETVLDPFLGSGTTLVAARDLKRNGIGYEINPEFAAEAAARIRNYQRKLVLGGEDEK